MFPKKKHILITHLLPIMLFIAVTSGACAENSITKNDESADTSESQKNLPAPASASIDEATRTALLDTIEKSSLMCLQSAIQFHDYCVIAARSLRDHSELSWWNGSAEYAAEWAARCSSSSRRYVEMLTESTCDLYNSQPKRLSLTSSYALWYNMAYLMDGSLSEKDSYLLRIINDKEIANYPWFKVMALLERSIIYFYAEKYQESEAYLKEAFGLHVDECIKEFPIKEMQSGDYIDSNSIALIQFIYDKFCKYKGPQKSEAMIRSWISSYDQKKKKKYAEYLLRDLTSPDKVVPIHEPIGSMATVGSKGQFIYDTNDLDAWIPEVLTDRTFEIINRYANWAHESASSYSDEQKATSMTTPAYTPTESQLANNYTEELGEGVKLEMVWIEGGTFQMGSPISELLRDDDEGPVHGVELDGFWIGKYEVTQAQYEKMMGKNPSYFAGADHNPVEKVSWNDAVAFCQKLSQETGDRYQLPSEAQWEYACRAGTDTRFSFGDSDDELGDYAWYDSNSDQRTHPVGQKRPNDWGLFDMHGNVYEWCQDWYHESYNGAPTDGRAWIKPKGEDRVQRGGGWDSYPSGCRSANRVGFPPDTLHRFSGFRVVCVARTQ